MNEVGMDDDKQVRAALLQYSINKELVDGLNPAEARDLLMHVLKLVKKHGNVMDGEN
jgi:hypothetical protein